MGSSRRLCLRRFAAPAKPPLNPSVGHNNETSLEMDSLVDIEKEAWHAVVLLTVIMSIATAIGTFVSSYILLLVKMKEEAEKAAIE